MRRGEACVCVCASVYLEHFFFLAADLCGNKTTTAGAGFNPCVHAAEENDFTFGKFGLTAEQMGSSQSLSWQQIK